MIVVNNRDKIDWKEGMTVQDLLDVMEYSYPLITVSVNGNAVSVDDYDEYVLPDHASVNVFHLAHGG